jgi:hypothetical protein
VCRPKYVEQLRNIGIINSTIRLHLVGSFYEIYIMMHGSMNIKFIISYRNIFWSCRNRYLSDIKIQAFIYIWYTSTPKYKGIMSHIIIAYMVSIICLSIFCSIQSIAVPFSIITTHDGGQAATLWTCILEVTDSMLAILFLEFPAGKCRDRTLIRSWLLLINLFFHFITHLSCSPHQILFGWSIKKRRMSWADDVARRVGH